ncbi:MAG TPA: DNA-processing protein DprA [Patescibacteria group bacterium]|nr:DNA-processing protein DprA [Patescibacteria group bacterium]
MGDAPAPAKRLAGDPTGQGQSSEPSEPEAWAILLAADGLGPAGFAALLAAFGSGRGVLEAAGRPGASGRLARIVAEVEGRAPFAQETGRALVATAAARADHLSVLRASGLAVVTLDDPAYPVRLRAIELPPPVLFVRGSTASLGAGPAVAIVGTRRPTERGRLLAARIAGAVSRAGAAVISGLAVGIDGAAHAAALAEGGPTVAVLGSGHERLFPRAHATLGASIVRAGGALISEFWPRMPPSRHTFPRRNRLISALADATVVVEAGIRSGALITATCALEQGRDLFIVPGGLDEPRSAGCLAWLREFPGAARIVASIPSLIEDLGLLAEDSTGSSGTARTAGGGRSRRPSLAAELIELGPTAGSVGRALVAGDGTLDELVGSTGLEPATVLGTITLLELRGLATSTYGRYRAAGRLASAPRRGPDP